MNKIERLEAKVSELVRDLRASLESAGIPSALVAGLEPRKLAEVSRALVPASARDARALDLAIDELAEAKVKAHAVRIQEARESVNAAISQLAAMGIESLEFGDSGIRFTVSFDGVRYRVLPDTVRPID